MWRYSPKKPKLIYNIRNETESWKKKNKESSVQRTKRIEPFEFRNHLQWPGTRMNKFSRFWSFVSFASFASLGGRCPCSMCWNYWVKCIFCPFDSSVRVSMRESESWSDVVPNPKGKLREMKARKFNALSSFRCWSVCVWLKPKSCEDFDSEFRLRTMKYVC